MTWKLLPSLNMGTVKKTDNNGSLSPGLRPSYSVTLLTAAEMLLPMRELVVMARITIAEFHAFIQWPIPKDSGCIFD